jgi:single-strand DNA-binding protein
MACVSGSLQQRDWTDKDGNKRRASEVVASNVYFADSKNAAENGGNRPTAAPAAGSFDVIDEDDGELPF